jgi:DNA-binding transcriptional regulator GbsR (MarR family)
MDDDVERAREEVIQAMERSAELYGFKRSYARLYGILFFAEEPLSMDELAERSDYAKSTVSTAMKALQRVHMVHRRSRPGEGKTAYFEAETDFWRVFRELLRQEVSREIDIMTSALDSAETALAAADGERAERDLRKVHKLQRVYDQSRRAIDVLTSAKLERVVEVLGHLRDRDGE